MKVNGDLEWYVYINIFIAISCQITPHQDTCDVVTMIYIMFKTSAFAAHEFIASLVFLADYPNNVFVVLP